MNQRGFGRGRVLVSIGAILALLSMVLPWWRHGGSPGLPETVVTGLSGAGIVLLFAAVLMLALVALPYASGDRPQSLDRPASYVVVAGIGVVGFLVTLLQIVGPGGIGALSLPDRSPGLWVGAVGAALLAWGATEIASERPRA